MAKWYQSRRARGVFAMLAWAISVSVNFFTSRHPWIGSGLVLVAVMFSIFLFWPEIKSLRIHNPKNLPTESPVWLYIFAIGALGMVSFACENIYFSSVHEPALLTSEEFAESYIHGKYFKIADLADSRNIIEGRTFEDCWIYGPAVLFLHQSNDISNNNEFVGSSDEIFMAAGQHSVVGGGSGVIVLKDCKFRKCHFLRVTFVGTDADIAKWKSQNH